MIDLHMRVCQLDAALFLERAKTNRLTDTLAVYERRLNALWDFYDALCDCADDACIESAYRTAIHSALTDPEDD